CGSNTSYLEDTAWVTEKTNNTYAEIKVSPRNTVKPNIGSAELAEALDRVLPFTAKEDNRPVLQSVKVVAGEGKLKLISADGFRLAEITLDFDEDIEGQALIPRDELKGIAGALRKAKRVRLGFEASGEKLNGIALTIDTEAIRYRWRSAEGTFPDYEKVIPTEFNTFAHLDSQEVIKAVGALKAVGDNGKDFSVDLTIGEGQITLTSPDEKGEAIVSADVEGEGFTRVDGNYLTSALKACGGMVDFMLTNSYSPMLFSTEAYRVVVMPMTSSKAQEQQKAATAEAQAQAETQAEPTKAELEAIEAEGQAQAEQEAEAKPKRKRSREKVAVA
ncbi:MAG: DNA polymerase III subunit beta, partial [Dehalococcoidia bacterium]